MLKFLVWNSDSRKYENLPREDVSEIIGEPVVEFLEMAFLPNSENSEEEIVEQKPDDCICSKKAFEVYGCMCRNRVVL